MLTVSQGMSVSCTYVLATLAEQGGAQECVRIATTTSTTASISNMSQAGLGRLHSTQRDSPVPTTCPTLSPDLSTIPMEMPPSVHLTLDNSLDFRPPDGDCLEGTPPAKRKNFMFRRCFDATFNPQNVPGAGKVLAPDSDEDME